MRGAAQSLDEAGKAASETFQDDLAACLAALQQGMGTAQVGRVDTTEMLDVAWGLFGKYFRPEEVNIKKDLVDQYWPKGE